MTSCGDQNVEDAQFGRFANPPGRQPLAADAVHVDACPFKDQDGKTIAGETRRQGRSGAYDCNVDVARNGHSLLRPVRVGRLALAFQPQQGLRHAPAAWQRDFAVRQIFRTAARDHRPNSDSRPASNCFGVGGQPRMTRSTGTTVETPPTTA
jgi:hypothetical protein